MGTVDIPLSPDDRALMMRMPFEHTVPQQRTRANTSCIAIINQVDRLARRKLVRVQINADASNSVTVTRVYHLTPAGIEALHERR